MVVPTGQAKARWDAPGASISRPAVDVDAEDMGSAGVAREYARQLQLARTPSMAGLEGRLAHRDPPAGGAELRRYGRSEGAFSCARVMELGMVLTLGCSSYKMGRRSCLRTRCTSPSLPWLPSTPHSRHLGDPRLWAICTIRVGC